MFSLLDRYVLLQFIQPFLLGICGGCILLLSQQLLLFTDLLIQKGVDGNTVLQLLILSFPGIIVVTFPIAGLFATLLVIGRMGADFELAALRASGVSCIRIFMPFLSLGLLISILAFGMNDAVVPYTNHKVRVLNQNLLLSPDSVLLEPKQFLTIGNRRWLYIHDIESNMLQMNEVLVLDLEGDTSPRYFPKLIAADSARWQDGTLDLTNANVWQFNNDGSNHYTGSVGELNVQVGQTLVDYLLGEKSPQEVSTRELSEQIHKLAAEGLSKQQLSPLQTEWHLKIAIPFSSIFAIAIATPLGLTAVRQTGRYGGVALAIAILFSYYVLLSFSRSWGQMEIFPPWLSAWLPNLVFGFVSTIFLWPHIKDSLPHQHSTIYRER